MTYRQLYEYGVEKLVEAGIDEAKLDDKSINKSNFIDIPSILRQ